MMNPFKYILSAALVWILGISADAQIKQPAKFGYGIKGSLNYTTIGTVYSNYSGSGSFSIGGFASYNFHPQFSLAFEPTYTSNSFREVSSDMNFQYNYIDFNLNTYFDIFKSEALWLYAGIKPGYLFNQSTQILNSGRYDRIDTSVNQNSNNQFDIGINAGVSVKISPLLSVEMGYVYSATNEITANRVKGRPSYVEVGLKMNALDLKNVIESKEDALIKKIKGYQQGSMFVMLPTISKKILGSMTAEQAAAAQAESSIRNKKIMEVFRNHYTFTPVFFFMDTNAYKVVSGNVDGIFVNENLDRDTSIKPTSTYNFFVASFCSDLSNFNQKISYGLFVYDDKMVQLERPFNVPSQVFGVFTEGDPVNYFEVKGKAFVSAPYEKAVKKLNSRLQRYANN